MTRSLLLLSCDPQKLYTLGGEVAESVHKCTHLVASKVTRTVKFLTAVSVVKHIVTPEWLEECFRCQKFIGEWWPLLPGACLSPPSLPSEAPCRTQPVLALWDVEQVLLHREGRLPCSSRTHG